MRVRMSDSPSQRQGRGMTLVEIIFAMTLVFLAVGMATNFITESVRAAFVSSEKNEINREVRTVVERLARDARQASYFLIYPSYTDTDHDSSSDRRGSGRSGDMLVLVYKEPYSEMALTTSGALVAPRPIEKVVIYYRAITSTESGVARGPVRRWEKDFAADGGSITDADEIRNPESSVIPSASTLDSQSVQVVEFSEGLASGSLFYNYLDRSIMVNGKILHGNAAKRVTDTYNFTISPRG